MRLRLFPIRNFSIVLLVLVLQNILYFYRHYFYGITFPDDFLLTYHAVPYYWIEAFKSGKGISWVPFQGMGYPLYLNLQSGANYPPFWLFPLFDETYMLPAAVIMQGIHVLLGGFGACVCARLLGLGWPESILAGIFYQSFGGFYSNSQHPDIIRAYAFIPWLSGPALANWKEHSSALTLSVVGLPIWVLGLWTGGYPGTAISSLFVLSTVCLLRICLGGKSVASMGLAVLMMFCIGTTLAGAALIPAALSSGELDRSGDAGRIVYDYMHVSDVLALAFPINNSYFTHDISMRSFFVGFPVIALLFIGLFRRDTRLIWPLVCGCIALMMAFGPLHRITSTLLPPIGFSRFVMADNRAIVCLMLILAASSIAGRLDYSKKTLTAWPLLFMGFICYGAISLELERSYANEDRIFFVMSIIVIMTSIIDRNNIKYRHITINPLIISSSLFLILYIKYANDISTQTENIKLLKYVKISCLAALLLMLISYKFKLKTLNPVLIIFIAIFSSYIASVVFVDPLNKNGIMIPISLCAALTAIVLSPTFLRESRVLVIPGLAIITVIHWFVVTWPERYFAPPIQDGVQWVESITGKFSETQERLKRQLTDESCRGPRSDSPLPTAANFPWSGYYTGDYFMQDYSGPMKLKRQQKILGSTALRGFAMLPWTMVTITNPEQGLENTLPKAPKTDAVCLKYGTSEVRYQLNMEEPATVVENETYSKGWSATLICENCGWEGNSKRLSPREVDGFRGWELPAGNYLFIARFEIPNLALGITISLLSLLLWIATGLLIGRATRQSTIPVRSVPPKLDRS